MEKIPRNFREKTDSFVNGPLPFQSEDKEKEKE